MEKRGGRRKVSGRVLFFCVLLGCLFCGVFLYQQVQVREVFNEEVEWLSHGFVEKELLEEDPGAWVEGEEPRDELKESLQAIAAENFLHDGIREVKRPMAVVTNAPKPPPQPRPRNPRRRRGRRGPPRQASLAGGEEGVPAVGGQGSGGSDAGATTPSQGEGQQGEGSAVVAADEKEEELPFTGAEIDSIFNNLTYLMDEEVIHKLFASQTTIGETHSGSSKKGPHKVRLTESQKELVPEDGKPSTRYKTCALVGNARSLLKKSHGEEIDEHDAVMRLNQATTVGFEKHVGKKTTFRLINSKWASAYTTSSKLQLEQNATLVVSRTDWRAFLRIAGKLKNKRRDISSMLLSREAVNCAGEVLRELKRRMEGIRGKPYPGKGSPSSGWVGTYFLLQMCDRLDIYGVGTTAFKEKVPNWHYFENHRFRSSREFGSDPHHSFALEHEALLLLDSKKIVFHHRD
ncbi:sialyltransferase [Chloropicon primus]|nr:sialyltransferase [Chloropicon primus]